MFGKKEKRLGRRRTQFTGSQKPPAVQYYRGQTTPNREQQASGRQNREPEQRRTGQVTNHLKLLPLYLSIAAIIISVIYCSILGNKVSIITSGSPLHEKTFYEAQAGEALNSSLFNHSKLTLDIRSLKENIKKRLPEASDVTVSVPLVGRKPIIGLSIIKPQFLLKLPDGKTYVVGTNGVVLTDADDLSAQKRANLQLLQEDVPLEVKVGQTIMTTSDIAFINTVVAELKNAKMDVTELELPVGASELYVHLKDQPYIIKFAVNGDARQQVGAYLAVQGQMSSPPASYVDVRIGERVYIK